MNKAESPGRQATRHAADNHRRRPFGHRQTPFHEREGRSTRVSLYPNARAGEGYTSRPVPSQLGISAAGARRLMPTGKIPGTSLEELNSVASRSTPAFEKDAISRQPQSNTSHSPTLWSFRFRPIGASPCRAVVWCGSRAEYSKSTPHLGR